MKVTEVARRAGIGSHAVRFYVRAGLLDPSRNPANNYKQFGEEHVARLRFIKGAQALGFSLAEIRDLLARMDRQECPCSSMHAQLADKILDVRRHMEDLSQQQAFMQRVFNGWDSATGGQHDLGTVCRFLDEQAAGHHVPEGQVDPKAAPRLENSRRVAGSKGGAGARGRAAGSSREVAQLGVRDAGQSPVFRLLQSEWNPRSSAPRRS